MSDRNVYGLLHRRIRELRRRDLEEMLGQAVSIAAEVHALDRLVARAASVDDARRLKRDALVARAEFERTIGVIVESIGDTDGEDFVSELLGDGGRSLAEILLDE